MVLFDKALESMIRENGCHLCLFHELIHMFRKQTYSICVLALQDSITFRMQGENHKFKYSSVFSKIITKFICAGSECVRAWPELES